MDIQNRNIIVQILCIWLILFTSKNIQAQTGPIVGTASINLGANQVSSPASIVNVPVNIDVTGMTAVDSVSAIVPLVLGNYRFAIQYDNTLIQPQLSSGNISGGTTFEFAAPVNANIITDATNIETLVIHASQPNALLPSGNIHVADIPFIVKNNTAGLKASVSIITMDLRTPISTLVGPPVSLIGGITIPNAVTTTQVSIAFGSAIIDTDADGLPDAWEVAQFGSLSRDGTGDFDSNGINDLTEFQTYYSYPRDGDATGDAVLNVADLLLLQRHVHGYIVLPDSQKARLDLYPVSAPDGVLNVQDMIIVSRMAMGL
jgi:hypothetical protein